ncbi:MAG: glycosyltransferase family 39 protein [Planctomycetota bacterium]
MTNEPFPRNSELPKNATASWLDLGLFLLIALFTMWGIGSYGLYEPHEAQYGGGATEMVQRGDWVTSYINGDREVNKPPLFYWLIATSYSILGRSGLPAEFVLRLPLALICLSGTILAWQWARELWGARAGRYAAMMLAAMSGWYVFAHQLMIDELLSVLVLLSLYFLWKALDKPECIKRWSCFYATIGVAVLAKGLLGIILPVLVLGGYIFIRREWSLIWRGRPIFGILLILAVVFPWGYLFESHNPGALNYIVINEHFKRLVDRREPHDYGDVQVSSALFVLFALTWGTPWSFFLPQIGSFTARNAFKKPEADRPTSAQNAVLLLGLGATLPVLFFVPISSRLIYYSLPAIPSLAILSAGFWNQSDTWCTWHRRLAAGVIALVGLVAFGAIYFLPPMLASIPDLAIMPVLLAAIKIEAALIGVVLLAAGYLIFSHRERIAMGLLVAMMVSLAIFNVREFANFDAITSSKKMVEKLAPLVGDDCVWISEGSDEVGAAAGTAFYIRQNTSNKNAFVWIMNVNPKRPEPKYPGPALKCFINQKQLDEKWDADVPTVYVTDFKRSDWQADKPVLPSNNLHDLMLPAEISGHRKVFANPAALNRLKYHFPHVK